MAKKAKAASGSSTLGSKKEKSAKALAKKPSSSSSKPKTKALKPSVKPAAKPSGKTPDKASSKTSAKTPAKASSEPSAKRQKAIDRGTNLSPKAAKNASAPVSKVPKSPKVSGTESEKKNSSEQAPKSVKTAKQAGAGDLEKAPKVLSAKLGKEEEEIIQEEAPHAAPPDHPEVAEKGEKKSKKKDDFKFDRSGNLEQQWRTIFERSKGLKPVPYKMSDNYEARTALMHKVLGWGYVISSQNNRLEVLFKDGLKVLIANYKSP